MSILSKRKVYPFCYFVVKGSAFLVTINVLENVIHYYDVFNNILVWVSVVSFSSFLHFFNCHNAQKLAVVKFDM